MITLQVLITRVCVGVGAKLSQSLMPSDGGSVVGVGRQRNALGLALGSFWLRYQHVRTMPITCEGVRVCVHACMCIQVYMS